MSNSGPLHTIVVPWRKFCASLPAVALISGGIVFATQAAPSRDMQSAAASSDSSQIVVPDTALTMPAVPPPAQLGPSAPPPPAALALVLPAGTVPGSAASVPLDSEGIPVRALEAYRAAATLVNAADPGCHIDWALLAAIGRVESNHGRFGGNQLDAAGVAQPGIIGIPLDGTNGTARITDTDGGALDRDSSYDRAVGPMQFIPGTWRAVGVDADHDGVKNPQDMTDAATSTAVYLCSGPGDLSRPDDLTSAIMRYNASDSYVRTVTSIAEAYRNGVTAIPASSMPVATVAPTATPAAAVAVAFAARGAMGASGVPAVPVITVTALAGAVVTTTAAPPVPSPTTTVADNNNTGTTSGSSTTTTPVDTTIATTVAPEPTTVPPDPTTTTVIPDPTTVPPDPTTTTVVPDPTTTTVIPVPTTTTTVPDACLTVDPTVDPNAPTATLCPTPTLTTTAP